MMIFVDERRVFFTSLKMETKKLKVIFLENLQP
jgi:hypothetical protein